MSIIIPVYQRQNKLDELVEQLLKAIRSNNSESNIEVVIIDDGSENKISLLQKAPYVSAIRNPSNLGAPLSREAGYKRSEGRFVHFHDSDDSINDEWLGSLLRSLKNNPDLDVLLTGRDDKDKSGVSYRFQKYFHKKHNNSDKINNRLIYRNCMGPLGGVTFSKRVLEKIEFKNFASCQDWQMYIDAMKHAKVLVSSPDIKFVFNKTGDDRISHNPRKKILGHLQLARITGKKSVFGRNIRLFYLYTCKHHIFNKGGYVLKFYKKNRLSIFITFLVVSVYWRVT